MPRSIRNKGIKKLIAGGLAGVVVVFCVLWLQQKGYTPNSFTMIALATPVAIGLVGLLEVFMNRPFSEMEEWWGSLRGWQRGALGLLVVIITFAILIGAVAAAGILGLI